MGYEPSIGTISNSASLWDLELAMIPLLAPISVGSLDIDLHLKDALLDSIAEQLVNDYTSRLKTAMKLPEK